MRHIVIGIIIGVLTIIASVYVLSEPSGTYETDTEVDRSVGLGESYEARNYTIEAIDYNCSSFGLLDDEQGSIDGCVLDVNITNTSDFELIFGLEGHAAVSSDGASYPSSQSPSAALASQDSLLEPIQSGETASGQIFFQTDTDFRIARFEIYESVSAEPIIIQP